MRVRVHRSRYKCHNRALCNSVDVLTTRVEFPSLPLWLFFFLPFPRPPAASPSILRTMQRFTQQYTIRGFNPLRTRDSYQGSFRDDSLATVSFYLNTPVTVNLLGVGSNSWTMFQGFFFFCKNLSSPNFQRCPLNYPKFKSSRFSQFPNAPLASRFQIFRIF